ncbi:translation initiation factor IF-2 [Phyllobacterium bourgognense]|uniref:Translation initiation factor IF-2 n=1 Tax=Phyllobacterium bourgognense TaxID=314236 RepID=A0A368ZA84_9HYPH|nr:translation initiation factor IF-2 [Phyllobacterium bourgognense]RCW87374.1 translation initiation factor 2 (bIF-2) [Phyllobacterium bourgognense]
MSDTKSTDDKTLGVNKKTLTLKRPGVEQSTVRQNFSHGRTKSVVVETKKRKFSLPDQKPEVAPPVAATPAPTPAAAPARPAPQPAAPQPSAAAPASRPAAPAASAPAPQTSARSAAPAQQRPAQQPYRPSGQRPNDRSGMVLNTLSTAELEARRKALEGSKARDAEDRAKAAIEAARRAEDDALRAQEREASARRQAEEEERLRKEAEAKQRAEEESRKRQPAELKTADDATLKAAARKPNAAEEDDDRRGPAGARRGTSAAPAKPEVRAPKVVKGEDERRRGKLTLGTALNDESRSRSLSAMRRRQEKFKRGMQQETREKIAREVILPETITIQELAQRMAERSVDVIKFLMKEGQMMKPGDLIDADTAQLIAEEFGHTVRRVAESDVEEGIFNVQDDTASFVSRPPVVTIMGHVDHGKTSLLDAIRKANVVSGEAGGITQHIGAYQVEQNGQKITFIDTPGHAAFTAMRARGAQATDIAILVVAADDSVMPQTIESINHAKAAGVPIIVAINKIDKPSADPQKVRNGLLQHEVFVESMGGETLDVEVSAKTGAGLDKLLETILLQAEVLDLKADPTRTAEGVVIEAKLDRGRGSVATVLVQKGTLRPGDIIVAGSEWGRVRALVNDRGENLKDAGPAMPVEVLGLGGPPQAGDRFAVVESEAKAREISEYRTRLAREKAVARQAGSRGSLEQMMSQLQVTGLKEFPLLIKGDVQGSIEAIAGALDKLGTDEVRARIIHSGAGGITESDIALAEASNAAIIGFNVRANKQARDLAEREGIEIRYYNIIYDLVDDVKAAMSGLLSPERRETFIGNAEILEVFNITKVGKVAGCRVTEGKVERGAGVRLIRDNVVIHEGKLKTLKRFKDEVTEVPAGQECGMAFENYDDMRAGDTIEAFRVEHVTRTL